MIFEPSLYPLINLPSQVVMANGAMSLVKQLGKTNPLLLITPSVEGNEKFGKLKALFPTSCQFIVEKGNEDEIEDTYSQHKGCSHDCVIAIGGGRVLDFSKLLRHSLTYGNFEFAETSIGRPTISLVAIPTYPGSGSETNGTAAIWKQHEKLFFTNPTFLPDLVIYDPKLLDTLNERLVALAVADIFTHAVESYFSKKSNLFTRSLAQQAILSLENFDLSDWNSKANKEILFNSGFLAGISVGNAFAGACHALAHAYERLTSKSHGQSVLNFTRANLVYHMQQNPDWKRYLDLYDRLGIERYREPKETILSTKEDLIDLALREGVLKTDSIRMKEENLEVLLSLL